MKRVLSLLCCFCLAICLFGCAGGVSLNREVSYDNVSWKVNSQWKESSEKHDLSTYSYQSFLFENGDNPGLSVYFDPPNRMKDPETDMKESFAMLEDAAKTSSIGMKYSDYNLEKVSEKVIDGATLTILHETYLIQTDSVDRSWDYYTAYLQKRGSINATFTSSSKELLDAVCDTISIS